MVIASRAQVLRPQQWWTPPTVTTLPDIDSIGSREARLILFDFEHALSLYRWGTSIYAQSDGLLFSKPNIRIGAEGRSRLRQDTRVRTSEAGASLGVDYPIDANVTSALLTVSATSYALDQKATTTLANIGKLSSINDGYSSLGLRHQFNDVFSAEVAGGVTIKAVEDRESAGPMGRARLTLSSLALEDDLTLNGTAFLDERRYNTTKEVLRNDGANLALYSTFGGGGVNTARAGVGLKRRDFFFPRDTSSELIKQERSELAFSIGDDFYYPIVPDKLSAEISLDIAPRSVTRRIPDVDLATLSSQFLTGTTFLAPSKSSMTASTVFGRLNYLWSGSALSTEIRYEERAEDNALLLEDAGGLSNALSKKVSGALNATSFESKSTVASLKLLSGLSTRDTLTAEVNARMYRFDTPSEENVDDRDEQYFYSTLRYTHRFTPTLELLGELKAASGHLVYIKSDRSAQNNRTKKLAFANAARITAGSLRNTLSAEVYANYTEYDFMLPTTLATNDFVIRGLSALDSFFYALSKPSLGSSPTGISFRAEYRISERGTFNPTAFSERPLLAIRELLVESLFQTTFGSLQSPVLVRLGARGFFLDRSSMHESRAGTGLEEDESSSRFGPVATVLLDHSARKGLRLYGTVWYSFISTTVSGIPATTLGTQAEARLAAEWLF